MGERSEFLVPVVARWLNSGVALGVGMTGTAVAIAAGMAPTEAASVGTLAGAGIGSFAEGMVTASAIHMAWTEKNVARFAEEVEDAGSGTLEDLINDATANPKKLQVLVRILNTAAHSLSDEKIGMLARIYVEHTTVRNGDDVLDDIAVLEEALRQLERPHLRLLDVLFCDPQTGHRGEHDGWEESSILDKNPAMATSFPVLIAKLQAVGFAQTKPASSDGSVITLTTDEHAWVLTASGREAALYLSEVGRVV